MLHLYFVFYIFYEDGTYENHDPLCKHHGNLQAPLATVCVHRPSSCSWSMCVDTRRLDKQVVMCRSTTLSYLLITNTRGLHGHFSHIISFDPRANETSILLNSTYSRDARQSFKIRPDSDTAYCLSREHSQLYSLNMGTRDFTGLGYQLPWRFSRAIEFGGSAYLFGDNVNCNCTTAESRVPPADDSQSVCKLDLDTLEDHRISRKFPNFAVNCRMEILSMWLEVSQKTFQDRMAHPSDCSQFIIWYEQVAQIFQCPPPLLFNPVTKACSSPNTVTCVSKPDGNYPHPHDCSLFLVCYDEIMEIYKCPPPLLFDPINRNCNLPQLVDCGFE